MSSRNTHVRRARIASAAAAIALLAAGTAIGGGAGPVAAAPPAEQGRPSAEVLQERLRGEAAIEAIGDRLPEVAARNDLTPGELARRLRADNQLWVGPSGQLLFVDEGLGDHHDHAEEPGTSPIDPALDAHTPAEAFSLHSRPGAARVIFLDFDGFDGAGSGWSGTPGQPYDTDGDPGTFSDSERQVIIDVWRHVAEDFAPFAIDVTTEDPGVDAIRRTTSTDQAYGTRVVVTPTSTDCSGCGGIAYIGTYDIYGGSDSQGWTHDRYQPAWVYIAGTNAKHIAEAASHEAGHNLGLYHDDTSTQGYYAGHGDWAPIMGVGYYEPISQWSKGEYADAQNHEDDFAVIGANGGPLAADDHGDTAASATPLAGPDVAVEGTIGTSADVDAFSMTTETGLLTLTATPAPVGPNLDIALTLRDERGQTVAAADPAGLSATLELQVVAGTYTVTVDGVGHGDPATNGYSDYASVGRYQLTGTLPTEQVNQAPTARPAASATTGTAPFDVTFDAGDSADVDGTIVSWAWDLGDGTTADTATVAHRYTDTGTYSVTLTVTDDDGASTTSDPLVIDVVANQAPFVDAYADVQSGRAPLTVTFMGDDVFDPEGDALAYDWTLDGVGIGQTRDVTVTLAEVGDHTAVLTVTDSAGNQASDTVVVTVEPNHAPAASAAATPTSGTAPVEVAFDGSGSSDPNGDQLSYHWDFGDGSTGTGVTTAHTYVEAGTYQATLTVSDGELSGSATVTIEVAEGAVAPSAPVLAEPVVASGVVTLDWDDASNVDTYTVYREFLHKNGTYRGRSAIATLAGSTSTFADQPGSGTFRYQVEATNPQGSAASNLVTATVTSSSGGGGGGGKGGGRPGQSKAR